MTSERIKRLYCTLIPIVENSVNPLGSVIIGESLNVKQYDKKCLRLILLRKHRKRIKNIAFYDKNIDKYLIKEPSSSSGCHQSNSSLPSGLSSSSAVEQQAELECSQDMTNATSSSVITSVNSTSPKNASTNFYDADKNKDSDSLTVSSQSHPSYENSSSNIESFNSNDRDEVVYTNLTERLGADRKCYSNDKISVIHKSEVLSIVGRNSETDSNSDVVRKRDVESDTSFKDNVKEDIAKVPLSELSLNSRSVIKSARSSSNLNSSIIVEHQNNSLNPKDHVSSSEIVSNFDTNEDSVSTQKMDLNSQSNIEPVISRNMELNRVRGVELGPFSCPDNSNRVLDLVLSLNKRYDTRSSVNFESSKSDVMCAKKSKVVSDAIIETSGESSSLNRPSTSTDITCTEPSISKKRIKGSIPIYENSRTRSECVTIPKSDERTYRNNTKLRTRSYSSKSVKNENDVKSKSIKNGEQKHEICKELKTNSDKVALGSFKTTSSEPKKTYSNKIKKTVPNIKHAIEFKEIDFSSRICPRNIDLIENRSDLHNISIGYYTNTKNDEDYSCMFKSNFEGEDVVDSEDFLHLSKIICNGDENRQREVQHFFSPNDTEMNGCENNILSSSDDNCKYERESLKDYRYSLPSTSRFDGTDDKSNNNLQVKSYRTKIMSDKKPYVFSKGLDTSVKHLNVCNNETINITNRSNVDKDRNVLNTRSLIDSCFEGAQSLLETLSGDRVSPDKIKPTEFKLKSVLKKGNSRKNKSVRFDIPSDKSSCEIHDIPVKRQMTSPPQLVRSINAKDNLTHSKEVTSSVKLLNCGKSSFESKVVSDNDVENKIDLAKPSMKLYSLSYKIDLQNINSVDDDSEKVFSSRDLIRSVQNDEKKCTDLASLEMVKDKQRAIKSSIQSETCPELNTENKSYSNAKMCTSGDVSGLFKCHHCLKECKNKISLSKHISTSHCKDVSSTSKYSIKKDRGLKNVECIRRSVRCKTKPKTNMPEGKEDKKRTGGKGKVKNRGCRKNAKSDNKKESRKQKNTTDENKSKINEKLLKSNEGLIKKNSNILEGQLNEPSCDGLRHVVTKTYSTKKRLKMDSWKVESFVSGLCQNIINNKSVETTRIGSNNLKINFRSKSSEFNVGTLAKQTENNEDTFKITCITCNDDTLYTESQLRFHLQTKHSIASSWAKKLICNLCFSAFDDLETHMKEQHPNKDLHIASCNIFGLTG